MAIAKRLFTLRRPPRYQRRPRVIANRHARESFSRESRWKRRGTSGVFGRMLGFCAGLGVLAVLWFLYWPEAAPVEPPAPFPDFAARAEAAFPESLNGHTRARSGTLADGREVPVGVTMLLPARALESASASPDALTRLAAPFVGAERAISGEEMGARVAALAEMALPDGISRCYSYALGAPRRIAVSDIRTVHVAPLDISFNPEC